MSRTWGVWSHGVDLMDGEIAHEQRSFELPMSWSISLLTKLERGFIMGIAQSARTHTDVVVPITRGF